VTITVNARCRFHVPNLFCAGLSSFVINYRARCYTMYMHGDSYVVLDQHATTTPTVDTVVRQVRLGKVTPWKGKGVLI